MKRIERKHLKEDELAHTLRVAREFVEPRQQLLKQVGLAAIVVLVIVVAYGFWGSEPIRAARRNLPRRWWR